MEQSRAVDAAPTGPGDRTLPAPRSRWAWIGAGVGLAALAYRPLLVFPSNRSLPEDLEAWFFVPSQTMGPVVLVLGLWLVYRRLPRLRRLPRAPGRPGVGGALLLAAALVHVWATYTGADDLLVPSLALLAIACAWLWKGAAAVRAVRLPVAFLLFAMSLPGPLLNEVVFRLQIWTTELAGWFLYLGGVPHYVSGEQIVRSQNTFSVIESCSGLRSIETLSVVAILMMDLFRRRGWHAWLVVLAAPPVAFFLNGLRALLLILNPHSQIAAIHNLQGMAILVAGVVLLFALDGLLEWLAPQAPERPRAGAAGPAAAGPVPGRRLAVLAAVLGGLAGVSLALPRWEPGPGFTPQVLSSERFAARLGLFERADVDWRFLGSTAFPNRFAARFPGVDREPPVELFVGIGSRASRHHSALSPKAALPGSGWIVEDAGWASLRPDGRRVRTRLLRSGSQRRLVYHWNEGALAWPLEVLRALLALDRSPLRRPGEILAVRIDAPVEGPVAAGRERAERRLVSFYDHLRPLLDELGSETEGKRISGISGSGKSFSSNRLVQWRSNVWKTRT